MWRVGDIVTLVGYLVNFCRIPGTVWVLVIKIEDSALSSRSSRSRDRGQQAEKPVPDGRVSATAIENTLTSRMGTEESLLDGRSEGLGLKECCIATLCSVPPRVFCSH